MTMCSTFRAPSPSRRSCSRSWSDTRIGLPDANSLILGARPSGSDLAAELLEGPPLLRVRPLSLPERARRLAGLPGAIVAAAVVSAILTAVPLLVPEPDAAAKRAEATLVETSQVSAALTALPGHTAEVGSAVQRAGAAAAAGQAHARELRRQLDGLSTGTAASDPAALRTVPALRESAEALLRDNQEAVDATGAAAAGVAGLRSSSTEISAWRDSLQRRMQAARSPAPWRDRLRAASGVLTIVTGLLAAWLAWRKLAPGGTGI